MSVKNQNTVTSILDLAPGSSNDPDKAFRDFIDKVQKNYKNKVSEVELKSLEKAYLFAAEKHKTQKRNSGEPYITHPIAVASILVNLQVDVASLMAAILHDTVEDTSATLSELRSEFGDAVANLVDGMTKIGKIKFRSNQEKLAENFRKMIMAMAKDLRVIIIKLCDRLHNMSTLEHVPDHKKQRISTETLEIYAPLANRLGIYGIKSQLEDLCLKYLQPADYQAIKEKISSKKDERQAYINEVIEILKTELSKYGFESAHVYGRPKHFFSIYKKIVDRKLDFEDIHDLFAFRIIVPSIKDCYEALGIVHAMWKPMPGRFKDYIAMPKANMYQSLHTTVVRPNGEPCEIQIRTFEMHHTSEFGVAAHWAYKENKNFAEDTANLKSFSWLRQIMEWQSEIKDPSEFLESVKVDLFDEEIFVFTPKGDVLQLSVESTALDFAFAIHTDVGITCTGAKVNGRIVPLKHRLHSGDIVEIMTSKSQKPSKDWLNFVTSSKAKNRIRSFLRSEQRNESKKIGKELLDQALSKKGIALESFIKSNKKDQVIKTAKESNLEDVYIALGYGRINVDDLLIKAMPEAFVDSSAAEKSILDKINNPPSSSKAKSDQKGILVSGINGLLVNLARCCSPLPGEPVVGFITRGKGVTVHKEGCERALALDPRRRVAVSWANEATNNHYYTVKLQVVSEDQQGVLADVTSAISSCGANIQRAEVNITQDKQGVLDFSITVKTYEQLQLVTKKIESLPTVLMVKRKIN